MMNVFIYLHDILGDPVCHLHARRVVQVVLVVQVQPGDGAQGLGAGEGGLRSVTHGWLKKGEEEKRQNKRKTREPKVDYFLWQNLCQTKLQRIPRRTKVFIRFSLGLKWIGKTGLLRLTCESRSHVYSKPFFFRVHFFVQERKGASLECPRA